MSDILKPTIPVFLFMLDEQDRVYLQRRYQTGYLDGFYETPAGKTDDDEIPRLAVVREAKEEAGVSVNPDDLELFHTYINMSGNNPWLGLMYRARKWKGVPYIAEPHKCDEAGFYDFNDLPEGLKITPQVKDGLARVVFAETVSMSEYDNIAGSA